jgi:heat-inducible transcriptional repressor
MKVKLNHRQQHVLWATVRHYIATAEPVGSKSLVEEYNLDVSPATIRNAMGALEKSGFLFQPHTSAGRVPSDSGYRIYVDQLMKPSGQVAQQVEHLLSDRLNWQTWSIESLLRGTTQILAALSGCVALITMPQSHIAQLRHLQLIQVSPGKIMLIVVLDSLETHSTLVDLPAVPEAETPDPDWIEEELKILSNFLNQKLRGRSLSDIAQLDWSELDREFQRYADFLTSIVQTLHRRAQLGASTQILVSGLSEVLRQPEFSEAQQVQTIVQFLEEEQDQLWSLIFEPSDLTQPDKRFTAWIGSENPLEPMRSCALVSSPYCKGSVPIGSVGVLGPTRMFYENAIPLVEAAADYLSEMISAQS